MLNAVLQICAVGCGVEGGAGVVFELGGVWVAFEVAVVVGTDCTLKPPVC